MTAHKTDIHNTIIVGTGPSGLTAALYTARADLKPLVFEGHEPGGQLTLTTEVENFPGFPEGVNGPTLIDNIRKQAARFGAEYVAKNIVSCELSKSPIEITDSEGKIYLTKTLIISTGASAKLLGLKNEKELIGRGVSTCATCDGFFYRNKVVHVVGGGDTAMEDANFISKFASKVYIVHRRDKFRASKPMQDRTLKNPKIEVLWNSEVIEIQADASGVTGIMVKNLENQTTQNRKTDGLFFAIGHTPNTSFLKGQLPTDEAGFLKVKNEVETDIPGVFACGDVKDPFYRQAITAAGSGCQAAIRAERHLEHNARH